VHLDVRDEADSLVYGRHLTWDGEVVNSLAAVLERI